MMEGWKDYYLKDIVDDLIMGQSPDSSSYNNEKKGIAFVQGNADMQNGFPLIRMHTTDPKRFSELGDILLSVRAPVGDVFYNNFGNLAIGRGLSAIRINNKDLRTLVFYLLHFDKKQFERLEQGTTFTEIGKKEVRNIRVVIPQNPVEQSAIVVMLSKVDEAITAVQGSIAAAERLKKSLMQNLLTGRMKPDGTLRTEEEFYLDEKFGRVPKGWRCDKFKEFAVLQRGSDLTDNDVVPGIYPVVKSNGVSIRHDRYFVEPPGVVTGRSGTIGKAFYIEEKFWAHNTTLYVKDFKGNVPKYIYYLILSMDFSRYYAGTTVPTLNRNDIHKLKVAIPETFEEQQQIALLLDESHNVINKKRNKIAVLERLKKSLMQNILTGKVRINQQ